MTSLVRTTVLEGYEALARSIGVEPGAELRRVGLSLATLKSSDNFISFIAFMRLMEHTALAGNCPDFGLKLTRRQEASIVGPLTVLMRHAATLEEALQVGAHHLFVLSPEIRFSILPVTGDRDRVDLSFDIDVPQLRSRSQTVEQSLGFIVQVLRLVTQGQVRPLLALLPHKRLGPPECYAEVLGCECRFEAPLAGIRIAARDLSFSLPDHSPLLQQMAQSYIDENFGAPQKLFTDRVRLLARKFLDAGPVAQADIAQVLSVHPKTLQRRLLKEGHLFNDLLDEVRRDRFLVLLDHPTALSLTQLALMLGYSEQAALTRSCRRWFGCTPTEMRRRNPLSHPPNGESAGLKGPAPPAGA